MTLCGCRLNLLMTAHILIAAIVVSKGYVIITSMSESKAHCARNKFTNTFIHVCILNTILQQRNTTFSPKWKLAFS